MSNLLSLPYTLESFQGQGSLTRRVGSRVTAQFLGRIAVRNRQRDAHEQAQEVALSVDALLPAVLRADGVVATLPCATWSLRSA
jgi:hypothetical protein